MSHRTIEIESAIIKNLFQQARAKLGTPAPASDLEPVLNKGGHECVNSQIGHRVDPLAKALSDALASGVYKGLRSYSRPKQ